MPITMSEEMFLKLLNEFVARTDNTKKKYYHLRSVKNFVDYYDSLDRNLISIYCQYPKCTISTSDFLSILK
jgi:hypothetical protein